MCFCVKPLYVKNNKRDEKRFCDDICKNKYHSYNRTYAEILINSGQLDFQTIKNQIEKNC